jgi:hypothetical protein
VRIQIGDAREVLLATPERYDLIFSEPSNPYRAGIASLFTREYYQAVASRLEPGGLFLQWVQGYEVDATTVRTVMTTLRSVFPSIQAWRTHRDLFFLASGEPLIHDVPLLRHRLSQSPFREALRSAWRVSDLEGFLAHHVAAAPLVDALARRPPLVINTDDRNRVEFGFARTVGRRGLFELGALRELARAGGLDRPQLRGGEVDWERVEEIRWRLYGETPPAGADSHAASRALALRHYGAGRLTEALAAWQAQPREPMDPVELALVAEGLAEAGHADAGKAIARLAQVQPTEAAAAEARWLLRLDRLDESLAAVKRAFTLHRDDPWPQPALVNRAFETALALAASDMGRAREVHRVLQQPFAGLAMDDTRIIRALEIATLFGTELCEQALAPLEPWVPWRADVLRFRHECYAATGDPRAGLAEAELRRFLASEPATLAAESGAE